MIEDNISERYFDVEDRFGLRNTRFPKENHFKSTKLTAIFVVVSNPSYKIPGQLFKFLNLVKNIG
jgi:hypothetical protein